MPSSFVKYSSFDVDYAPAKVTKWRSERTGLQLVYINQPSPIVNGYFAVATEIPDDSGCPHTLEHLIFMGSKKYPYKGLLDTLGNRLFSTTNAWTSVDQTVYTLTSAGWDGFKALLPVYLDHLLSPTLTDEACLTEVYHVDGKGKEKGVVFSEMQGIESQSWFVTFLNMQRKLYAKDSGYSSETGGLMSELRHLTNDQIKEFHKSSYRPDNLCIIITGFVDESELLNIVSGFDSELDPLPSTPNKRPFLDSKHDEPLSSTIIEEVEFPEKDESMGEIVISWIGPRSDDMLVNLAVDMIGAYFSDSPISFFNKHLVEIENPLANEIDYNTDDYVRTTMNFSIGSIPTEHLKLVDTKVKDIIKEHTTVDNFDLNYMKQILHQQKLKFVSSTERSAQIFANVSINEFIYGNKDGKDLERWLKSLEDFEALEKWSSEDWTSLIKKYFVENHSATILGKPSSKLNKSLKQQSKDFLRQTKEKFGEEGLKKLQEKFDHAQEVNNKPIPEDIIKLFDRPDPAKIQFIDTDSFKAGSNTLDFPLYKSDDEFNQILSNDTPTGFPLSFHFEHYKSQFTTVHLILSSTTVDKELLKYMSVLEEIFGLSVQTPDGQYIPYNDVISQINNDLIEFQLDNGFDGQFYELTNVKVKFENQNYAKAIDWVLKILKYSVFEESRVKVIIEKIINSLPEKKRNGELMMYSSQLRTLYTDDSIRKAQDCINTESFYKELLTKIENGQFKDIENDLNRLRSQLFNLDNIKVVVIGNAKALLQPISTWTKFVEAYNSDSTNNKKGLDFVSNLPRAFEFHSDIGEACKQRAYITTVSSTESSYLAACTPIPKDYFNKDIYSISLACEFLRALEGPLYRGIRGTGLAYGASVRQTVETGYLSFSIYRGADVQQAWIAGKKAIEDYANGTQKIEQLDLQSSIAGIVNGVAEAESNAYDAAAGKFNDDILKKRGPNFIYKFIDKLNQVTTEDVVYVLKKYFIPLFSPESSLLFACVPPTKSGDFTKFLQETGYQVSVEEIGAGEPGEEAGGCCSGDDHDHSGEDSGSETDSDSESDSDSEIEEAD